MSEPGESRISASHPGGSRAYAADLVSMMPFAVKLGIVLDSATPRR